MAVDPPRRVFGVRWGIGRRSSSSVVEGRGKSDKEALLASRGTWTLDNCEPGWQDMKKVRKGKRRGVVPIEPVFLPERWSP